MNNPDQHNAQTANDNGTTSSPNPSPSTTTSQTKRSATVSVTVNKSASEQLPSITINPTATHADNLAHVTVKVITKQQDELPQPTPIASPWAEFAPAEYHPSLDTKRPPIDPARPLDDFPEPANDYAMPTPWQIGQTGQTDTPYQSPPQIAGHGFIKHDHQTPATPWQLIQSQALAEHLTLLQAGGLITLPNGFFEPADKSAQDVAPLPSSLLTMTLLDMADIHHIIKRYPNLSRHGLSKDQHKNLDATDTTDASLLANRHHAESWQTLLYPHHFSEPAGSLKTDLLAVSVANHVLKQSDRRKTINTQVSAERICQHVRSYLLSQCVYHPATAHAWQHIAVFVGHVIAAAIHQGYDMQVSQQGDVYFNLSSRTGLLTRYPVLSDYMTAGWQE